MKKVYVGIDVGRDGGIFAIDQDRNVILKSPIPQTKDGVDYQEMLRVFKLVRARAEATMGPEEDKQIVAVIEDVHSLFGMSAKSNFSFGHIKGVKEAMMVALGYNYKLIPPKQWQKAIWIKTDMVKEVTKSGKSKTDTKATSLNAALRIYPNVDFTKSIRATKPHDGIVDASLMAEFARINDED